MKIETVTPDDFYEAFPHYADRNLNVTEDLWGTHMSGRWEERIDDLVLKDIATGPENYNGGTYCTFHIFANPFSVHVPSAIAMYERANAALNSTEDASFIEDFPEIGSDQDLRERYAYDVGMYAEDLIGHHDPHLPGAEWFTICGSWEETMASAPFGYAPADPERMVVLFS